MLPLGTILLRQLPELPKAKEYKDINHTKNPFMTQGIFLDYYEPTYDLSNLPQFRTFGSPGLEASPARRSTRPASSTSSGLSDGTGRSGGVLPGAWYFGFP